MPASPMNDRHRSAAHIHNTSSDMPDGHCLTINRTALSKLTLANAHLVITHAGQPAASIADLQMTQQHFSNLET